MHRELKKHPHETCIYNLSTAQNAGIIIDLSKTENLTLVKGLVKELESFNIKCKVMVYIDTYKRDDNYIGDSTFSYACKSDFSFFYKPKKETVEWFINAPFNLLIVLSNKPIFPIYAMGLMSKASFKAGLAGINNEVFDLMIELHKNDSLPELKNQIMHYLSILNQG